MALLITDPIDWGLVLDANGNLDFPPPGSNIDASSGLAAVVQGARIRLALTAGEWFLNLDRGVARFKRDGVEPTRVIFGAKFSVRELNASTATRCSAATGSRACRACRRSCGSMSGSTATRVRSSSTGKAAPFGGTPSPICWFCRLEDPDHA